MNKERFELMVKFMQGMTTEDVYGSSAIKRDVVIEEPITNVVADTTDNDDIILPFNCVPMHKVYGR